MASSSTGDYDFAISKGHDVRLLLVETYRRVSPRGPSVRFVPRSSPYLARIYPGVQGDSPRAGAVTEFAERHLLWRPASGAHPRAATPIGA